MVGGNTEEVTSASDRTMSIGEVLSGLEPEFPDITISKIRFLESQGLLDPQRTASGYRKFSVQDMTVLRWILRQQREHFLPLKVIRQLLDESGGEIPEEVSGEEVAGDVEPFRERGNSHTFVGSVSVSLEELAKASGLEISTVQELEKMGLLFGHEAGSVTVYDDDSLLITRLASTFLDLGFDIRHLRMYLVSAQREAGTLEQVLLPLMREDSVARSQVNKQLDELIEAGSRLRRIVLRRSLGRLGQ
tara:strand:- start:2005 stop:2745 length:741 start_codon:yes stop_codon:yes gene_type:complete